MKTTSAKALVGNTQNELGYDHKHDGVERRGINRPVVAPEFLLHTGHISHLSKPDECDTVAQMLGDANPTAIFSVSGGHDVPDDDGNQALG